METKTIATVVIALIIGLGGGYLIADNRQPEANEHMMGGGYVGHDSTTYSGMSSAMNSMMRALDGKTGDEFDKAFLSGMIAHHQGAVAMAELALKDAKHQEIKDLAQKIITTQTAEITQMQGWEKTWYGQ